MVTLREEGAATATGAEPSDADCAVASCRKGQSAATVRSNTVNRTRGPGFGVWLSGLSRAHGISVLESVCRSTLFHVFHALIRLFVLQADLVHELGVHGDTLL